MAADSTAADDEAGAGVSSVDLRELPDQLLQEKLHRMQADADRGFADRLPDGGKTYRIFLLAVRREMETPACPSKQMPDAHIIKPKIEPCEDSLSLASDASEDFQTTPLSCNHPFFTIILSRTHVQKPFQLCIPGRFHRHLPEARTSATLICLGRSWAMTYCGDLKVKRLGADWKDFAVDNRLQVNDGCVFELVTGTTEEVVFQMQILRGGLPKEITSKGTTADEPLVIVD